MITSQQPLVFLIHGIMGHPNEFSPLIQRLNQQGLDTHTVCLPQHGDSPGDLGGVDWTDLLDHCQAELEWCRQRYGDVHLLGFSLGGALGVLLANRCPEAFQSLTLVAAPYKPVFNLEYGQYHLKHFFNRFLPGMRYVTQQNTGYPKPSFYPHYLPRFYEQMQLFFSEVQNSAEDISISTLLIHSPYDLTVPYEHSEWFYGSIPGATNFVTLLQGGHQVFPYNVDGVVAESILNHILVAQPQRESYPAISIR